MVAQWWTPQAVSDPLTRSRLQRCRARDRLFRHQRLFRQPRASRQSRPRSADRRLARNLMRQASGGLGTPHRAAQARKPRSHCSTSVPGSFSTMLIRASDVASSNSCRRLPSRPPNLRNGLLDYLPRQRDQPPGPLRFPPCAISLLGTAPHRLSTPTLEKWPLPATTAAHSLPP